jgi:hypothetical protein
MGGRYPLYYAVVQQRQSYIQNALSTPPCNSSKGDMDQEKRDMKHPEHS